MLTSRLPRRTTLMYQDPQGVLLVNARIVEGSLASFSAECYPLYFPIPTWLNIRGAEKKEGEEFWVCL